MIGIPSVAAAFTLGIAGNWVGWVLAILLLFIMRGLFSGLVLIAIRRLQPTCIAIEEGGVGFGDFQPDWWVFTDGIVGFRRTRDLWTIHHYNGTFLSIPADVISIEDTAFLKSKAASVVLPTS